jgi:tRNA 2-selenouridine synthase
MRSNIMAWMLQMAGMRVVVLKDGYKSYRQWAIHHFTHLPEIIVLGGKTGSGKTEMLYHLKEQGENIIDLEKLANHRGSAYGHLGMETQPMQEMFENLLAWELAIVGNAQPLWLENESRNIGLVHLPNQLYDTIRTSRVVEMEVDIEIRKKRILQDYGQFPVEDLIEKTVRLTKRLGGQHVKAAVQFLRDGDYSQWLDIVLHYYDKTYQHGNNERKAGTIRTVEVSWKDPMQVVVNLIVASKTH